MNGKEVGSVFQFVKRNVFQILGLLVLAGNVWIAYQLSPVVARIGALEVRATAMENRVNVDEQYIPRFLSMEAVVNSIDKRLGRIESLLDRIYGPVTK